MSKTLSPKIAAKLRDIRLFLCDVDGVLTDSSIYIGPAPEMKRFHIRDGLGLQLLQREGIRVGWVSFRPSPATKMRANELKIDFLIQKKGNKVDAIESLLDELDLEWSQVCFVGDDLVDLGALVKAGLGVAVADAIAEAIEVADLVTKTAGGHGAVREAVELILKAQGKWPGIVAEFSK